MKCYSKKADKPTVTMYLGVSNFQRAISIVIPRSRSAFSLSKTQAAVDHVIGDSVKAMGNDEEPTIFEGALAELSGFLLEFFDGTLVNTTALIDQVPSCGGLSGVDVSDD